jgi:CRISPR-associated protein Cmr2
MSSYLLLVSLGPVQDFIASARRTRDLHFGSWFLSELSRAAAYEIVRQNKRENLIFPYPDKVELLTPNNRDLSVANKIIALVEQSPDVLGPQIQKAVFTRLEKIRDEAYGKVSFQDPRMRPIAHAQVEDLVEVTWAALPFNDGQNYQRTRQQLEALMAARKNTRDFKQTTPWQAPVPKSSIDGKLESVIPESEYPDVRALDADKTQKIADLYEHYKAGPAERLSGVDLLKRNGTTPLGTSFPSTSHMATSPFLERLKLFRNPQQAQVRSAWTTYIQKVQGVSPTQLELISRRYGNHPILGDYEGSMLLEDRLVDVLYEPGETANKSRHLQTAKQALQGFYRVLDQQFEQIGYASARPGPYYALLQADGDGMGALIDVLAELGEGHHRELSHSLALFAGKVKGVVEQTHRGALVYAGGDDVVALLPLDTVLACASKLSSMFRSELQKFTYAQGEQSPSLSVGIALVHHLDALGKARRLAQEAEKRAKGIKGKNALAITMSKRSGEDYSVTGQWGSLDASLNAIMSFYQKGVIPAGTAYELRELIVHLGFLRAEDQKEDSEEKRSLEKEEERRDDEALVRVMQFDALRILRRKLYVPKGKFEQKAIEEVEQYFHTYLGLERDVLAETKKTPSITPADLSKKLEGLINELIIAQVLTDAQKMAAPVRKGATL